jgi:Cu(I)/Ag(I) efflux system membrane fusion protein
MKILSALNIFIAAGLLTFASCENNNNNNSNTTDNTETENKDTAVAKKDMAEDREDVFDAYEDMKDALVKDNMDNAKKAAEDMKVQLDKVKTENLTPADITNWNKEAKKMREHLDKIQAATNIEEMRTHFSTLSEVLYADIKKYGLADETVYYQYCPMAFDNKGANWLSEDEEINNPYFGDKMLRCGETKDTIEKQ